MEGHRSHHAPQKSSSFSSFREEKPREIDRNFSLGAIKLEKSHGKKEKHGDKDTIQEEDEEEEDRDQNAAAKEEEESNADEPEANLTTVSDYIDEFLGVLLCIGGGEPPDFSESTVENFFSLVEKELTKYESSEAKCFSDNGEDPFLEAVKRLPKLTLALASFSSEPKYHQTMNRSGAVLHRSMCFLEDEFHSLLQDPRVKPDAGSFISKAKQQTSFNRLHESDRSAPPSSSAESNSGESPPPYPPETVEKLRAIADAMLSAGYDMECCNVFAVARRNVFEAALPGFGYDKISIEDVVKMAWDTLEGEITTWIKAFKHAATASFAAERDLCESVFAGHREIADHLFRDFAGAAVFQLLSFAEAIAMTKRSAEKLFKVLDIYEALRDVLPTLDALLPDEAQRDEEASVIADPKTEVSSVQGRLGETAVALFCDLESSIKADNSKTPVRGGAIHPLTRYVMNYLKYACEYKNTLEQVFKEHKQPDKSGEEGGGGQNTGNQNPFATQLLEAMNLLFSNLDTTSKLYKDPALSNIFLMNNGRYIAKKVKGSPEIHQLLGETWYRRRSTELRKYHKNYQRETWSRVLACLRDDGLQHKGGVQKPVLKERFKSFNAMIEETHKTQSMWVVSDEQLQSELRVSVSAVVVPAYRSFLGRFSQYLDPGRQTEKYIKFGPEDLENLIDELFDGNPSSTASKKR